MVKVLIADDHAVVRGCILRLLGDDPTIEVLGEASGFSEAISKAKKLTPDVLIVDLHMPDEHDLSNGGLRRELNSCSARILGISFANDEEAESLARNMGAVELLDKTCLATDLIPAILRLALAPDYALRVPARLAL